MDDLLEALRRATIGATFNQYAGADGAVRLANLRQYLAERASADVVALGEAAGYQGMRWSGIAFTSERDLARWGPPYRATSDRPNGWSEPSGTIVHRVLDELAAERRVILWNTVPHHPHHPGRPLSNRRPSVAEVAAGAVFAERLLEIVQPRLVLAVGRIAEAVLGDRGVYVRHPANGGAAAFAAGISAALAAVP
jgi:uracil DNA glycosylase superfamily protein